MIWFVLFSMIFCHIIDDYVIQWHWLSNGKQRRWWQENAPDEKYKHDYIAALMCHAFSWSFMIMLPIAIVGGFNLGLFFLAYPVNMFVHAFIDDIKANKLKINLLTDQSLHLVQIVCTLLVAVLIGIVGL